VEKTEGDFHGGSGWGVLLGTCLLGDTWGNATKTGMREEKQPQDPVSLVGNTPPGKVCQKESRGFLRGEKYPGTPRPN